MSLTGGARHRCRTRRRMDTRLWRRSSGRTAPPSRAQRRRSCSARRQLRATSTAWCGSWPRGAISTCRTTTGGPHSISPPRKGTPRLFAGYCCTAPTPKPSIGSAARLWTTHIARTGSHEVRQILQQSSAHTAGRASIASVAPQQQAEEAPVVRSASAPLPPQLPPPDESPPVPVSRAVRPHVMSDSS